MNQESPPPNFKEVDTLQLDGLLTQSAALHKHLCPKQVLGVRMGLLGGTALGIKVPQDKKKQLFVFMETDGCAADGVSVATGCWVGRRTMRLLDFGKVAATFVDRGSGSALRIRPQQRVRQMARQRYPDEPSRWHAMLKAYQDLPDSSLFMIEEVSLMDDLEQWISQPTSRVVCEECGEEIINQRQIEMDERLLCRACAGDAYYLVTAAKGS